MDLNKEKNILLSVSHTLTHLVREEFSGRYIPQGRMPGPTNKPLQIFTILLNCSSS
jgi:hypothetical protein